MSRNRIPPPRHLDIRCACTVFGTPMIRTSSYASSMMRRAGAEYECPTCGAGRRASLVPRLFRPARIILTRF